MWIRIEESNSGTMHAPIGIKEAFVKDRKKNRTSVSKLSKSLTTFLAISQIVFGFNFGFIKQVNRKYKMAVQCVSMVMTLIVIGASVMAVIDNPISIFDAVQYTSSVAILLPVKFTLYDFLSDLTAVNNSQIKNHVGIIVWIYTTLILCLKFGTATIAFFIIINKVDSWTVRQFCEQFLPTFALEILAVANFVMYYYLYIHLKDLKSKIVSSVGNWGQVLTAYKQIVDDFDRTRPSSDKLMILAFIFHSPKWILCVWHILRSFQLYSESWIMVGNTGVYFLLLTIEICVPAVCAELVQAEVNEIKDFIEDRLLTEYDSAAANELIKLLRYMEGRALIRKAWRLLPVDVNLPVTFFSMCTTYLVVMIQLTHLYD